MIWFPLILTALAALHLIIAFSRFDLNDWTLAFAMPIWACVLLTAWAFWLLA